ncbi:MAG: cytochrome C oxidase subunit IV family protein [Comamonadaceae bacterium]|jgi:hypothetical protein|nr:cytochrome C oxidase subunit IV family protein [Comamonadaceae bacterium]
MTARRINTIWVLLLLATALTWWLGESGNAVRAEFVSAAIVLGLAAFKGYLIAMDYMELRHAPRLWRGLVLGWLLVVALALIGVSFWHSLR